MFKCNGANFHEHFFSGVITALQNGCQQKRACSEESCDGVYCHPLPLQKISI